MDSNGNIELSTKGEVNLNIEGDTNININNGSTSVKCLGNVEIESNTYCEVKSPEVKITGGMLQVNGSCTPTGFGGFCGIPICPATGLPHTGNQIIGT
jgi:hypothetical protein